MAIDKLNLFIKVTKKLQSVHLNLLAKDKIAADKGAVDPMRRELNK